MELIDDIADGRDVSLRDFRRPLDFHCFECFPYFEVSFPKSLDRFDFSYKIAKGMSLEDGAATLTALVGASVGRFILEF